MRSCSLAAVVAQQASSDDPRGQTASWQIRYEDQSSRIELLMNRDPA